METYRCEQHRGALRQLLSRVLRGGGNNTLQTNKTQTINRGTAATHPLLFLSHEKVTTHFTSYKGWFVCMREGGILHN